MEFRRSPFLDPAARTCPGGTSQRACYLHIGTHKTGSTSIQAALNCGGERLKQFGFLYPSTGRTNEYTAHHNIVWELGGANMFRREIGSVAGLLKEIESCEHDIILSSEDFSNLIGGRAFKNFVVTLQDNNFRVCIVVYLRNQIDYIRSLYLQGLHHQRTAPFARFIQRALGPVRLPELGINYLNYRDMLNCLRATKEVDLIVRSYDESKKTSVVRDFMSILGLTGNELGIDLDHRANIQPPLAEAFELFFHGQFGRAPDWGEKKIIEAIFETLGDRPIDISWPSQKKVIRKFLRSNEHVYEKYGIPEFKRMRASRLTVDPPPNLVNLEDLFSHRLLRFVYDVARTLSGDRQSIVVERDTAVHDRNMIAIAWNKTCSENGQLAEERNVLIQERDLLAQEKDEALRARDSLAAENIELKKSSEALKREFDDIQEWKNWRFLKLLHGWRRA
jgi:hypothetical protein